MTDRLRFTEEMAKAGGDAAANYFATHDTQDEAKWLEVIFRAMLAAAPQEEYELAFVNMYNNRHAKMREESRTKARNIERRAEGDRLASLLAKSFPPRA